MTTVIDEDDNKPIPYDVPAACRAIFLRRGIQVYPQAHKLMELAMIFGLRSLVDLAERLRKDGENLHNHTLRDWYMGANVQTMGKIVALQPPYVPLPQNLTTDELAHQLREML